MQWTEETISQLRALWDEGLSTAEIGRRLGMSKNAVVGKAHRLELTPRPSPIRPLPEGARPRSAPRRVAGPTLPPLASTRPSSMQAGTTQNGAAQAGAAQTGAPILRAVPATRPASASATPVHAAQPAPAAQSPRLAPVPPPRPYGRVITCCWPIGEPGTKQFRFCDVESMPGKPYCEAHAELAYVKVRDRREDAA
jgi:GcrA cell cycle regulator